MNTIKAAHVHSSSLEENATLCSRCGIQMSANYRAKRTGTTPICNDCRESDKGLALLWRKK